MGTPANPQERHKATYDWGGLTIQRIVREDWPDRATPILDVGAGWGKYRDLLPEYTQMDACEVWWPNVVAGQLATRYRRVYAKDIRRLALSSAWRRMHYDVVIFGDVLEHLWRPLAIETITLTLARCTDVLVLVPFQYEQGIEDGNPYEEHLQPDLTPEMMQSAYPMLRNVSIEQRDGRPFKGLYRKAES